MSINVLVGNDNGNSLHKIKINDEQVIINPNVISKVRNLKGLEELNKEFIINNIKDNLIVTIDSQSCEPGHYLVGNRAINSSEKIKNIEIGVDNNKLESEIPVVSTLSQIAGFILKNYKDQILNNDETIKVIVDMATALPITQYNKKNAELFSKKFTENKHKITLHLNDLEKVHFEIDFSFTKIIPEGVDTIFALQSNEIYINDYNKINNTKHNIDFFKNKKILHIPIGDGSTDLAFTDGIKFNPEFNLGLNLGVGHAIERSIDEFKEKTHLRNVSRQMYSDILKNHNHKYNSIANEIVEEYLIDEADEIIRSIKQQLQKINNDVDVIVVYGGGSVLMRFCLEKKLKELSNKANVGLYYMNQNLAITVEAEGLYNFANSNIFKKLKKESEK